MSEQLSITTEAGIRELALEDLITLGKIATIRSDLLERLGSLSEAQRNTYTTELAKVAVEEGIASPSTTNAIILVSDLDRMAEREDKSKRSVFSILFNEKRREFEDE